MGTGYHFFGWEHAGPVPVSPEYADITGPRMLYDLLRGLWCAETCAPRMRKDWTPENPTLGQCSITAFLAQDIFGGKVYGVPLDDGNFHCFNVVSDHVFDLTSEQFGDRVLDYTNCPEQYREAHFAKTEKRQRYEALKKMLDARPSLTYESAVQQIVPGRYRHFKGGEYEVLSIAHHSETTEPMVVYRALYGKREIWVRPAAMWQEIVVRDGRSFPRFTRLSDANENP